MHLDQAPGLEIGQRAGDGFARSAQDRGDIGEGQRSEDANVVVRARRMRKLVQEETR
jgi:hypothetical protein